jgi:hypothetical protein
MKESQYLKFVLEPLLRGFVALVYLEQETLVECIEYAGAGLQDVRVQQQAHKLLTVLLATEGVPGR